MCVSVCVCLCVCVCVSVCVFKLHDFYTTLLYDLWLHGVMVRLNKLYSLYNMVYINIYIGIATATMQPLH